MKIQFVVQIATLALNQSCTLSDQCAGSPYASCFGGKCTCIEGYAAENSTKCVQSQEITESSSLQHHQEETKIGTTLGALFGGLLLGVILTTVAVAIIYRRSKTRVNKREEPTVAFADNNRYSLAKIVDHGTFQNIQSKDKKREVSPYACSKETWIYDNVYSKPRNRQTQEAIYNHLHEQVKQDDDDYYDHACAASAHIRDMEDYSHVQQTTS
uniref:EB domain-containing protein n=1 Tax=Magallana gigas TaxID=29159 RepID=A0A8W8IWV3_MAGGI|nr:uncharacterized protein LOC105332499 [Crassostrea gigas]